MKDAVIVALGLVGLFSSVTGAVGVLRMPDVYTRIQCSSKTVTTGVIPVLVAVVIQEGVVSVYGSRALLVTALLLLLNPAVSHALARAAYRTQIPMWPGAVRDEPRQEDR